MMLHVYSGLKKGLRWSGIFWLGAMPYTVQAAKVELFNEQQLVLPFNLTQSVVAANVLTQPGNELVMLGVNQKGQRQLAIYALNASNKMVLHDQITLDNRIFAFDVGDPEQGGLQHLYFVGKNQLWQYHYSNNPARSANLAGPQMSAPSDTSPPGIVDSLSRLEEIEQVNTLYLSAQSDAIVQIDFAKDVNHDQIDDFVLAEFEQLNLYLSQPDSALSARVAQTLDIAARLRVDGTEVSFHPRELWFSDMNLDGKSDIVVVDSGRLGVYQQSSSGSFNPQPAFIKLADDIEGIDWWDKIDADGQQLDQSELRHKKVEAITDVNGDGLADLIVRFTQSSGVLDRKNDYEFFYGKADNQQLVFAEQAATRIQSDSTLSDLKWVDLDQDGQQEIMVAAFDLGVSQIISALLSSSIEQEALIFKMDDNQLFSAKPTASQDVEITFSLSSGRSGEPMVKAQDVNGDKLKDLIFSDGEEQIKVLFAEPDGKRLFQKRAEKYTVKVPKNAKEIVHSDLNGDGKTDLILQYSRADSTDLLNKVVVLIAN